MEPQNLQNSQRYLKLNYSQGKDLLKCDPVRPLTPGDYFDDPVEFFAVALQAIPGPEANTFLVLPQFREKIASMFPGIEVIS